MGKITPNSIGFIGSVDDLVMYMCNGQHIFRTKDPKHRERFKTHKKYKPVRQHGDEWKMVSKIGRSVRKAFAPLLQQVTTGAVSGRLNGAIYKVMKTDAVNPRGERKLENGNMKLMTGFQFNDKRTLEQVFKASYKSAIDPVACTMQIDIPSFIPSEKIVAPANATHFKILSGVTEVNWAGYLMKGNQHEESGLIALNDMPTTAMQLVLKTGLYEKMPLALVLGIAFYNISEEGEAAVLLAEGALKIVQACISATPREVIRATSLAEMTARKAAEAATAPVAEKETAPKEIAVNTITTAITIITPEPGSEICNKKKPGGTSPPSVGGG